MTAWIEVEHLPTRKRMVSFNGRNGADIAALVDDTTLCYWDEPELVVVNDKGEFKAEPGDWLILEYDGSGIYPIRPHRAPTQYRLVEDEL